MTRFEDDPDAHERWLSSVEAEDHLRERDLERADRHGPAPVWFDTCSMCHRDLRAVETCSVCGDHDDMANAA